ncbi:MAG: peptide chain release factor N(5)-glutamine methyltransferase [Gemmatimonadota bacterium]
MAQETVLSLAQKAASHLAGKGLEQARLESELMLAAVLGISRLDLYLQHDRAVDDAQLEQFRSHVRRRLKREPLQYILGRAAFRKLELQVDRRVLIPRPETEVLVDQVIRWLQQQSGPQRVLDLGTGSGAIALSLVRETDAQVTATDVSDQALAVARGNAERLSLSPRVEFRSGSLWQPIADAERFDAIVSNPPYVADHERESLQPEVRDWEPAQALFAGANGLDIIELVIDGAAQRLRAGGLLALELGVQQAASVRTRIEQDVRYTNVQIHKDLSGRERVVVAETHKG